MAMHLKNVKGQWKSDLVRTNSGMSKGKSSSQLGQSKNYKRISKSDDLKSVEMRKNMSFSSIASAAQNNSGDLRSDDVVKTQQLKALAIKLETDPFQFYIVDDVFDLLDKNKVLEQNNDSNLTSLHICEDKFGYKFNMCIISKSVNIISANLNDNAGSLNNNNYAGSIDDQDKYENESVQYTELSNSNGSKISSGFFKPNIKKLKEDFGMMALNRHENLLFYKESFVFDNTCFVVFEHLVESCPLRVLIDGRKHSLWKESYISYVLNCIVSALYYLHKRNRILRNLSWENVLISRYGAVKISRLETCCEMTSDTPKRKTFIGSAVSAAPEMILCQSYDTSVDIWSLGILCLQIANPRQLLFAGQPDLNSKMANMVSPLKHILSMSSKIRDGSIYQELKLKDCLKPKKKKFSNAFKGFVNSCFGSNLLKRATSAMLVDDIFLKKRCLQTALAEFLDTNFDAKSHFSI